MFFPRFARPRSFGSSVYLCKNGSRARRVLLAGCATLAAASLISGCSAGFTSTQASSAGTALSGTLHGGQQPVSGARIYLYAVGTSGYGSTSASLLNNTYVTTDSGGNWSITADYTCPAGASVYVLALGGNPGQGGSVNNSKLGLMAGLGACSSLLPTTRISIDEVTTVATVYALAPFMSSETQIGSSSTNAIGMSNAFGNIPTLVNIASGTAYAVTPAGNGTVPQAEIDTLANALAPCVNSDGTGTACTNLMSAANVSSSAGTPVDTVQAMLNIARNPGANVTSLYNLSAANAPFQPALTTAPNDFTMQVAYTGNLNQVQGIAVDANGNIYASNSLGGGMSMFSPSGTFLKSLTAPYIYRPQQIGIDLNGNIWLASRLNATTGTAANLAEFSSTGALLSGAAGFTGGGLNTPRGLAVDNLGNIWAAGNGEISEFTSAGFPVSSNTGYTTTNLSTISWTMNFDSSGNAYINSTDYNTVSNLLKFVPIGAGSNASGLYGGSFSTLATSSTLDDPLGVALDHSNNVWVGNSDNGQGGTSGSLTKYTSTGNVLSSFGGYRDGGLLSPQNVIVDGLGYVYTSQDQVSVRTNAGVALSPTTGYQTTSNDCCLASAIDASGNYWTSGVNTLFQWIGLANPVVTPLVKGVVNNTIGVRP